MAATLFGLLRLDWLFSRNHNADADAQLQADMDAAAAGAPTTGENAARPRRSGPPARAIRDDADDQERFLDYFTQAFDLTRAQENLEQRLTTIKNVLHANQCQLDETDFRIQCLPAEDSGIRDSAPIVKNQSEAVEALLGIIPKAPKTVPADANRSLGRGQQLTGTTSGGTPTALTSVLGKLSADDTKDSQDKDEGGATVAIGVKRSHEGAFDVAMEEQSRSSKALKNASR